MGKCLCGGEGGCFFLLDCTSNPPLPVYACWIQSDTTDVIHAWLSKCPQRATRKYRRLRTPPRGIRPCAHFFYYTAAKRKTFFVLRNSRTGVEYSCTSISNEVYFYNVGFWVAQSIAERAQLSVAMQQLCRAPYCDQSGYKERPV
jgi:hypothetical protein